MKQNQDSEKLAVQVGCFLQKSEDKLIRVAANNHCTSALDLTYFGQLLQITHTKNKIKNQRIDLHPADLNILQAPFCYLKYTTCTTVDDYDLFHPRSFMSKIQTSK